MQLLSVCLPSDACEQEPCVLSCVCERGEKDCAGVCDERCVCAGEASSPNNLWEVMGSFVNSLRHVL